MPRVEVLEKCSYEIQEITYILEQLRKKRVYELSDVRNDGSLSFNADKLQEHITNMLIKLQNGTAEDNEKIRKDMDRYNK